MEEEWTRTLLDNLSDPTVKRSMEALTPKQRKTVQSFLEKKKFPEDIGSDFVQILQQVLQGLEKLTFTAGELKQALSEGGMPCTVSELKSRFQKHLDTATKGKDQAKVRIVIE
jgi:hypothetical protein